MAMFLLQLNGLLSTMIKVKYGSWSQTDDIQVGLGNLLMWKEIHMQELNVLA